ncbi:hypothetical protein ACGFJ7_32705 [Actinoplanes sp. NPDC048988]|uniref:hypothetical protein n=1 Tax=Actinoplanes sp. NPDC048988 TaxID=3363901 RepID=UPI0037159C27
MTMNDETAVLSLPENRDDDDGFATELAKAAPKRWWNKGTIVLGAVVLLVGGFVGGLQAQKQWGTADTPGGGNRAAAFGGGQNRAGYGAAGGFPGGGQGFPGAPGNGAPGSGNSSSTSAASTSAASTSAASTSAASTSAATTGTVKLVNGTTIYVETADGTVVTVKTDGRTKVSTATPGKVADVKAGQSVTVQGAAGTDGAVTATSVTASAK